MTSIPHTRRSHSFFSMSAGSRGFPSVSLSQAGETDPFFFQSDFPSVWIHPVLVSALVLGPASRSAPACRMALASGSVSVLASAPQPSGPSRKYQYCPRSDICRYPPVYKQPEMSSFPPPPRYRKDPSMQIHPAG